MPNRLPSDFQSLTRRIRPITHQHKRSSWSTYQHHFDPLNHNRDSGLRRPFSPQYARGYPTADLIEPNIPLIHGFMKASFIPFNNAINLSKAEMCVSGLASSGPTSPLIDRCAQEHVLTHESHDHMFLVSHLI